MKKTINIVRLENGQYVKSWQILPLGYCDKLVTDSTANIFQAVPITFQDFMTYFKANKSTYLTVEITAKIL